jgi:hypothetical protein
MLDYLNQLDHQLFLAINHWRNPFLDVIMPVITNRWVWIPLYVVIAFFLWHRFGKQTLIIAITVALLIVISDQSANLLKNNICRVLRSAAFRAGFRPGRLRRQIRICFGPRRQQQRACHVPLAAFRSDPRIFSRAETSTLAAPVSLAHPRLLEPHLHGRPLSLRSPRRMRHRNSQRHPDVPAVPEICPGAPVETLEFRPET